MEIEQAKVLAERYLARFSTAEEPLAFYDDESVDDLGWCFVFPWNTVRYIETRDISHVRGPGYGPIVVVKDSGDTWMMGGFAPEDEQLSAYAAKHGISPGPNL
ncbi:immunity protein 35 of polymorphic toxin system [Nonomuraea polychroma]|uniref:Immunity protein 35 of polymorphic toxin system n=1 Tax=Nonomuraea polychroma TaxID=46176 RepID=A0A438LWP5_9ACTN|nr:YrhB domain-containing protein [Nonomuraea polychroma]RVX37916.1 immunity protein 35 of polymorphic toxin system [Nonomuraea polychroma]